MRKTSQDGGDSTSIASGLEIDFKKSGFLKSKKNSIKKKAQILSNDSQDNDDAIKEPLLQKDNKNMGIENQSAKCLSLKSKTDSTRDEGSETENLLIDKTIDKPSISDVPGITGLSYVDSVVETSRDKSNSMLPIHNHMLSKVFNSNIGAKESVIPKSQILIEIDDGKQSVYSPSPLIFTTAKIHIDGKNRHNMDPVHVTPIPILSTIENSGTAREPNGSIKYINDNNLIETYAKPGANITKCVSTYTPQFGESSVNINDVICSLQLTTTSNITSLVNSRSKINAKNPTCCEENRMDNNKNMETVNIVSKGIEANLSLSKKCVSDVPITDTKVIKPQGEVTKPIILQNHSEKSNTCGNFNFSSANTNIIYKMTTVVSSGVTFTSAPNVSVSSSISTSKTLLSKAIDTELSSSVINPVSTIKTTASKNVAPPSILDKIPTSSTIISNNANNNLSTTMLQFSAVKSNSSVKKSKSPSEVLNVKNGTKNVTKSISSTSTVSSKTKAKSTTVSNTVTFPSINQTSKLGSLTNPISSKDSNNKKCSSLSSGTKIATVSVIIPSSLTKSSAISSNKSPKDIISQSILSSTETTFATSDSIKVSSKANATTASTITTSNTLSSPSTSKESSASNKVATNKRPVSTNTAINRTTTRLDTGVPSSEPSVSRKMATNKTPVATNKAVNTTTTSSATTVPCVESSESSNLVTNKRAVATTTPVTRTVTSFATAASSVETDTKSKVANKQAEDHNNDHSNHEKDKT